VEGRTRRPHRAPDRPARSAHRLHRLRLSVNASLPVAQLGGQAGRTGEGTGFAGSGLKSFSACIVPDLTPTPRNLPLLETGLPAKNDDAVFWNTVLT
nr:hypothetical protein [Tanacetum cinerariifolium]